MWRRTAPGEAGVTEEVPEEVTKAPRPVSSDRMRSLTQKRNLWPLFHRTCFGSSLQRSPGSGAERNCPTLSIPGQRVVGARSVDFLARAPGKRR